MNTNPVHEDLCSSTIMNPTYPTSEGTFYPLVDGVVAVAVNQMFLTTGQPLHVYTFIYTRLPVEL